MEVGNKVERNETVNLQHHLCEMQKLQRPMRRDWLAVPLEHEPCQDLLRLHVKNENFTTSVTIPSRLGVVTACEPRGGITHTGGCVTTIMMERECR